MPSARSATRDSLSMRCLSLSLVSFALLMVHGSLGQDFVFPDSRPTPPTLHHVIVRYSTTTTTTTTTAAPTPQLKCPANMTETSEPGSNELYCECIAGNLYYPKLDRCYQQYTQGPCEPGEHFVLRSNKTVAECVRNPCKVDKTVLFKGSCYKLYVTGGPCDEDKTLAIPETSYGPECVGIITESHQVITAPLRPCAPGSRRTARGKCRKVLR